MAEYENSNKTAEPVQRMEEEEELQAKFEPGTTVEPPNFNATAEKE